MRVYLAAMLVVGLSINTPVSSQTIEDDPAFSTGPSELDILSSGDDPFLDFNRPERRAPVSVTIRALNKITAKYTDLVIPMNETASFGSLTVLARHCDTRPPEEFPETTAFVQIFDERSAVIDVKANAGEGLSAQVPVRNEIQHSANSAVDDVTENLIFDVEGDKIFSGWMFASSPALNPLEHPVYDVWVIGCETSIVIDD